MKIILLIEFWYYYLFFQAKFSENQCARLKDEIEKGLTSTKGNKEKIASLSAELDLTCNQVKVMVLRQSLLNYSWSWLWWMWTSWSSGYGEPFFIAMCSLIPTSSASLSRSFGYGELLDLATRTLPWPDSTVFVNSYNIPIIPMLCMCLCKAHWQ